MIVRKFKATLIIVLLVVFLVEGSALAWLLTKNNSMRTVKVPELEEQGKEVMDALQRYDLKAGSINSEFPAVTAKNWMQLIEGSVKGAGATLSNHSSRPPAQISGSDTRELRYNLTVIADDIKALFDVASRIEKIDGSGAVRVSAFNIAQRKTEDAPFSCIMEVVIYELSTTPEETPAEEPETPELDEGITPENVPVEEGAPE
jgi:hypothetical protein